MIFPASYSNPFWISSLLKRTSSPQESPNHSARPMPNRIFQVTTVSVSLLGGTVIELAVYSLAGCFVGNSVTSGSQLTNNKIVNKNRRGDFVLQVIFNTNNYWAKISRKTFCSTVRKPARTMRGTSSRRFPFRLNTSLKIGIAFSNSPV